MAGGQPLRRRIGARQKSARAASLQRTVSADKGRQCTPQVRFSCGTEAERTLQIVQPGTSSSWTLCVAIHEIVVGYISDGIAMSVAHQLLGIAR